MIIKSPLSVPASGKRKFILNLNTFRNAHYQVLNKAKINYKAIIAEQVLKLPMMRHITIHYTLYPGTKRRTDIGNVIAIHRKFIEDALVELGRIPDDNYQHVLGGSERFGCVNKDDPHVEIRIELAKRY